MFRSAITDVFFDLDHTLWDFERNSRLTFERIFEKHNVPLDLDRFLGVYVPINLRFWKLYREEKVSKEELRYQRLRQSFDSLNLKIKDKTIDVLSDDYIEHLSRFGHVLPGTFEILDYLRDKYRLHIITNGFEETQKKKMINAKIWDYFEVIVNSEMAGVKKPNPKIFQLALKRASVAAQNSLMIGDNLEADILGAQAVGFQTIHFNSNDEAPHQHCEIIHHLDEIKRYL